MTAKHGFKPKLVGDSRLVKALRTVGEDDLAGATQPGGNPREPIETRAILHTVGIVDYTLAGKLKIVENIVALRQRKRAAAAGDGLELHALLRAQQGRLLEYVQAVFRAFDAVPPEPVDVAQFIRHADASFLQNEYETQIACVDSVVDC